MKLKYVYFSYLISNLLCAQSSIVFNRKYDFGDSLGGYLSTTVFKDKNDFILTGILSGTSFNYNNALGVIKTDSLGNEKWQKIIKGHNGGDITNNSFSQFFIQLKDKNVLATGQLGIGAYYTRSLLSKIDHVTGDTLWMKEYTQPGDTSYLFCSSQLADSSIISLGYTYYDTGALVHNRPFMMKIDKNGNYLWHKFLWNKTTAFFPNFGKLYNINNKEFIVTGANNYLGVSTKAFLIRFDTNGVIIYNNLVQHANYTYRYLSDLIPLQDGTYLSAGAVRTNQLQGLDYWRPWLYNFNPLDGTVIKSKLYGQEKRNGHQFDRVYLDSARNTIYASGAEWFLPQNYDKVTFYKFNSNLDSLFTRYFDSGQGGTFVCGSFVRANDLGFAFAMQVYPGVGKVKYWLIKTDSLGCSGDSTCLDVTIPIGIKKINFTESINIYPNPTNDLLNITILNPLNPGIYKYEINNILGENVAVNFLSLDNEGKTKIRLGNLKSGVYVFRILRNDNVIVLKKIIKAD